MTKTTTNATATITTATSTPTTTLTHSRTNAKDASLAYVLVYLKILCSLGLLIWPNKHMANPTALPIVLP